MLYFAAVAIENPVSEVGLGVRRVLDEQNLVAADAELPVSQRTRALRGHFNGGSHPVEHDKVVARAMHFGEVPDHARIIANFGLKYRQALS